jgi:hypothetical protein
MAEKRTPSSAAHPCLWIATRADVALQSAIEALRVGSVATRAGLCLAALTQVDRVVDEMRTLLAAEVAEQQAAEQLGRAEAMEVAP